MELQYPNLSLLYEDPDTFIAAGFEGSSHGEKMYRFNVPIHQRGVSLGCGVSLHVPDLLFSPEAMTISNLLGMRGLKIITVRQTEIDGNLVGLTFHCKEA